MMHRFYLPAISAAVMLCATSGCGAHAVPSSDGSTGPATTSGSLNRGRPADTTSILKKLKVQVSIGSTVDASNGDEGPRAIAVVPRDWEQTLTKGQLVVCNFEDSHGVAGNGTTVEVLDPKTNSKPARFYQNDLIKGCDGVAISYPHFSAVYGAGFTSGKVVAINENGKNPKIYGGKILKAPLGDTGADPNQNFSPQFIFTGSTASGGIVSIGTGFYGNGLATQVAKGFAVSHNKNGSLGPSGLRYDRQTDTLYIVDAVTNTVVAFSNASKLLAKDEIIVKPDGKTFQCKYASTTCGTLVYSGSPLDAPVACAVLPNGNLVVANSEGTANTLVELTPQGQVLDTEVVDSSATQGVYALVAKGTNDSNTVIYFTDTNSNTVQELKR